MAVKAYRWVRRNGIRLAALTLCIGIVTAAVRRALRDPFTDAVWRTTFVHVAPTDSNDPTAKAIDYATGNVELIELSDRQTGRIHAVVICEGLGGFDASQAPRVILNNIAVDATPMWSAPGTVFVLQPDGSLLPTHMTFPDLKEAVAGVTYNGGFTSSVWLREVQPRLRPLR